MAEIIKLFEDTSGNKDPEFEKKVGDFAVSRGYDKTETNKDGNLVFVRSVDDGTNHLMSFEEMAEFMEKHEEKSSKNETPDSGGENLATG